VRFPKRERLPLNVEVTERAMRDFLATVGRHPPETAGMFAGRLDQPNRLLEFRFCPPRRKRDGSFDRSSSHLNLDAELMNWIIDEDFRMRGLDMLGMGHSHPGQFRQLSYGDAGANEGDVVYLKSCLAADDSEGQRWKVCWAPIVTFDMAGKPVVDWFAVTTDDPDPIPVVATIISDDSPDPGQRMTGFPLGEPEFPIYDLMACHHAYRNMIAAVQADEACSADDRAELADQLNDLRRRDLRKKLLALGER
jgi:proteasome lid subunit RPN8/RPN11